MALYLDGIKRKIYLDGVLYQIYLPVTNIDIEEPRGGLLSLDNFILKDVSGLFLLAKEE